MEGGWITGTKTVPKRRNEPSCSTALSSVQFTTVCYLFYEEQEERILKSPNTNK